MRRNVCKRNMYTSTSEKMHVAYVATFPLHCFNYLCTLTETSQYTRLANFCLSTYACYVYERSVALFIVDGKQAWPRCGISLYQQKYVIENLVFITTLHVHTRHVSGNSSIVSLKNSNHPLSRLCIYINCSMF